VDVLINSIVNTELNNLRERHEWVEVIKISTYFFT